MHKGQNILLRAGSNSNRKEEDKNGGVLGPKSSSENSPNKINRGLLDSDENVKSENIEVRSCI
jgi:hypothetical protein